MKDKNIPFLKWPGGKRWLIDQLIKMIPDDYIHYYEPFLGGGSVFFAIKPSHATISDINDELINLYIVMRDNPQELKGRMCAHNQLHSEDYYYQTRSVYPSDSIDQAARFLYLNRTCYNGMYRVNKQGQFNVPIGTKNNCMYDIDLFDSYSQMLKGARILKSDFSPVICSAGEKDLIFADPPYAVKKSATNFIKYNEKLFTWNDQIRLHRDLLKAKERGARIIHTNIDCAEIKELYIGSEFYVSELSRHSCISGKASGRNVVTELLITSFPQQR